MPVARTPLFKMSLPKTIGLTFCVAVLTCGVGPTLSRGSAEEPKLHALVIGNSDYAMGKLRNPVNDAVIVSGALKELGFQVTQLTNVNQVDTEDAILKFSRSVGKDGLAFFFFAGHGVQVKGENYLIPTDAKIREEFEVRHQCISLGLILDALENSRSNLNVVVLDCCRDNPFARAWSRSSRSGLAAATDIPEGTLIAFATPPGKTALDGKGKNSPFTTELVAALRKRPKAGLLLRDVFFDASRMVKQKAGQSPWVNMEASLAKFYLTKPNLADPAMQEDPDLLAAGLADSKPTSKNPKIAKSPSSHIPPTPSSGTTLIPGEAPTSPSRENRIGGLFHQANIFLQNSNYSNAIVALSAIINDPAVTAEKRKQARMARGSAYLSRGHSSDLELAIIDHKAAGLPGIRVPVQVDSSPLKVSKATIGTVRRNQILLVTLSQGDWLWVHSVNDNETLQGYVKKSVVSAPGLSQVSAPTSKPEVTSTKPSVANMSPMVSPGTSQNTSLPGQVVPQFTQQSAQVQPFSNQPIQQFGAQPSTSLSQPSTVIRQGTIQQNVPAQVGQPYVQPSQYTQAAQPQGTTQPNAQFTQPQTQQYTYPNQSQYSQQHSGQAQQYTQSTQQYQPQQRSYSQQQSQYRQPIQTQGTTTRRDGLRQSFIESYNRQNQRMGNRIPNLPSNWRPGRGLGVFGN